MDHPKPWLRYIEADKIDDQTLHLDGMKVRNEAGEKLGSVDGLIIDSDSGRTYYIVVDAPGWFSSRQWLLPIGQTRLEDETLVAHVTREQVNRFPGFDKDEFEKLSETDIKRINDDIGMVLEPAASYRTDEPYYAAWSRTFYEYPDWWAGIPILPLDPSAVLDDAHLGESRATPPPRRERSKPLAPAEVHDVSPHFDGRAQPGDVIGIETGGEETHIGDTREDENERREKAEETDRKKRG